MTRCKGAFKEMGYFDYDSVCRLIEEYQLRAREKQKTELRMWAEQLAQRERALEQWEAALAQRQTELQSRQIMAGQQARAAALEQLDQISSEARSAIAAIRALAGPLGEARDLCSGSFLTPYLEELCRITRSMHRSGEPSTVRYADALDALLRQMGCEPIVPQPGQTLDYLEMAKLDAAQAGETVDTVRSTGWRLNDRVLEKAVVTVKEEA